MTGLFIYYLFIKYYIPLHVSSLKCSSSGGYICIHAAYDTDTLYESSGSIPGGVTGFFSDAFPSDGTKALGSTQPLVKMSTRNMPGGKGGRCVRLTTYHNNVPLSRNLGALTSQNPLGLFRPDTGQLLPHL